MTKVDYANVDRALQRVDSDYEAADCHGVICGILAVDDALSKSFWMGEVMVVSAESNFVVTESQSLLNELYAVTREQLYGPELHFIPLLPDDSASLRDRVRALRKWCEGFTYGLALAGLTTDTPIPQDLAEIIKDFTEIAKATVDDDAPDQQELAYAELVEYIRISVMLACEELRTSSTSASS